MATRRKIPIDPYDPAWFVNRIRAAGPLASELLVSGLLEATDGDPVRHFQALSGDADPIAVEDDDFPRIVVWMLTAYAVGIAVGSRLQPGALEAMRAPGRPRRDRVGRKGGA